MINITVNDAVKKIRFLAMTPKNFVSGPMLSRLLTDTEKFAIIGKLNDSSLFALPDGFSQQTERSKSMFMQGIRNIILI